MRSLYTAILFLLLFAGPAPASDCLFGMDPFPGYRPFAPDSPWNTPIAFDASIAADSDAMIARLEKTAGRFTVSLRKWTAPLFIINSRICPVVQLPTHGKQLHGSMDPEGDGRAPVPMPPGIWPDPEADGHLILADINAQQAWEFSQVRMRGGVPVSASRMYVWDLKGPGFQPPFSGDAWWTVGATASGLPLIGGLVTYAEFRAGAVNHALICALPIIRRSTRPGGPLELCPPASRTDGRAFGADSIPMGARLQLDPDLNLAELGLSAEAQSLARAMQRYGLIVGVNSGTFKIFLQNMGADGTKWAPYGLKKQLARIPVSAFRVLDCPVVARNKP